MKEDSLFLKGSSAGPWAQALAAQLGAPLIDNALSAFGQGEVHVHLPLQTAGKTVFILQGSFLKGGSVNDSLVELYLMASALRHAGAGKITLVLPYIPYSRQDGGLSSSCGADIARLIERSGVDTLVTIDVHSATFQGFFQTTQLHTLSPWGLFAQHLMEQHPQKELLLVAPDQGSVARTEALRHSLSTLGVPTQTAQFAKTRDPSGHIRSMELSGDVAGQHAVLVDDVCDSAETVLQAARILKKSGVSSLTACITHVIASDKNLARLLDSPIEQLTTTDSIPLKPQKGLHVLSIAPLLCRALAKKW